MLQWQDQLVQLLPEQMQIRFVQCEVAAQQPDASGVAATAGKPLHNLSAAGEQQQRSGALSYLNVHDHVEILHS